MNRFNRNDYSYFLFLGLAFAVGAVLRLYYLPSQILLDDEWHGVAYVIGKSYLEIHTQFNPEDYSSPLLNLYRLFISNIFGWSEFGLRFPSLLAGILSLIILPLWIRKIFSERLSLLFAFLLAISPFSIFYSRFSRAYSLAMLLCFWGLLLFYQWLSSGKARYAIGFIILGCIAAYAHFCSIFAVVGAPLAAIGIKLSNRIFKSRQWIPKVKSSMGALINVTIVIIVLAAILLSPTLSKSAQLPLAKSDFTSDGLLTALTLVSGVSSLPLNIVFYVLFVAGIILLIKERPLIGSLLFIILFAYTLILLITRPKGADTGIVLLRYTIIGVSVALLSVGYAIDRFCAIMQNKWGKGRFLSALGLLLLGGFFTLYFIKGPIPEIYAMPNNFSNHSAFQGSYESHKWSRSDARHVYPSHVATEKSIPKFYHWLAEQNDFDTIIEYPFDICNFNNLYYYYQHYHTKRVIMGYCRNDRHIGFTHVEDPSGKTTPYARSFITGVLCIDGVLAQIKDPDRIAFKNMVDLDDTESVFKSGADFIVLHKYYHALKIMQRGMSTTPIHFRGVDHFNEKYRRISGPPVYEDEQIICFKIGNQTERMDIK